MGFEFVSNEKLQVQFLNLSAKVWKVWKNPQMEHENYYSKKSESVPRKSLRNWKRRYENGPVEEIQSWVMGKRELVQKLSELCY